MRKFRCLLSGLKLLYTCHNIICMTLTSKSKDILKYYYHIQKVKYVYLFIEIKKLGYHYSNLKQNFNISQKKRNKTSKI